jgi:CRISPR system Cascade subunit CasE
MYLSRLILNPRSRQVQRELADPYEMHRTICRAFPRANFIPNESSGILFRLDVHPQTGIPSLMVQSLIIPDWSYLLADRKNYLLDGEFLPLGVENPDWKEVNLQLRQGQALAFRLRANPTIKKDREGKKQGWRVGLIHEDDQRKWLARKFETAGAALVSANISNEQELRGKLFIEKDDDKRMRFLSVQFDGLLRVINPQRLYETLQAGIGSGKGFGFGLLSLAPPRG